jgi:hypothetical protein
MPIPLLTWSQYGGSQNPYGSTGHGYFAGASGVLGFGHTPGYLALDVGRGMDGIIGAFAGTGIVHRFSSSRMASGNGLEFRANFDVLLVQIGVRILVVGIDGPWENMILGTLGLGRF